VLVYGAVQGPDHGEEVDSSRSEAPCAWHYSFVRVSRALELTDCIIIVRRFVVFGAKTQRSNIHRES